MKYYHLYSDELWEQINTDFGVAGGVYKLFYIDSTRNEPKGINRLFGTDKNGVLYIGKADSFLDRVIGLKKTLLPNYLSDNHIAGRRIKNNPTILKNFPLERLFVTLISSDDPLSIEKEELIKYELKYDVVCVVWEGGEIHSKCASKP